MAVVSAICNGTIPIGLAVSFLFYKEKLTSLQVIGSLACLAGILTLSLSVLGEKEGASLTANPVQADTVEHGDAQKGMQMMIIDSFASMFMVSARISLAKYCSRILSTLTYLKLYLLMDSLCAFFITFLSAIGVINLPLEYFFDADTIRICFTAGCFSAFAELFLARALRDGPTGPISAVISINSVLVSAAAWLIDGTPLTPIQIVGMIVALSGVFIVSRSKPQTPKAEPARLSKMALAAPSKDHIDA